MLQNSEDLIPELAAADLGQIVDEAIKIAEQRASVIDEMKVALLSHNDGEALRLARVLCGLPEQSPEAERGNNHV